MKLNVKRFWILLIAMASAAVAYAQSVFSVEEIRKTEYVKAAKERSRYNIIPTDSITDNEIVNMVLKESRSKFERLHSDAREDIYLLIKEGSFGFNKKQILYLAELKLYGFVIPDELHEESVWWFDSEIGKYVGKTPFPTAINTNGTLVAQTGYDCDWRLDLRFFGRATNGFYEFESYKSLRFNGETVVYQMGNDKFPPIFWQNNNILYLKTYDHYKRKEVFLKIKVQ